METKMKVQGTALPEEKRIPEWVTKISKWYENKSKEVFNGNLSGIQATYETKDTSDDEIDIWLIRQRIDHWIRLETILSKICEVYMQGVQEWITSECEYRKLKNVKQQLSNWLEITISIVAGNDDPDFDEPKKELYEIFKVVIEQ